MKKNRVFGKIDEKEYPVYRKRVLTAINGLSGFIRVEYGKTNGKLRTKDGFTYLGKSCQL